MAQDWIDSFVASTENSPSPLLFRRWAAITTLSGLLSRRVWAVTAMGRLYPNLYTILVGSPASGKSAALYEAAKALARNEAVNILRDPITTSALLSFMTEHSNVVAIVHEMLPFMGDLEHISDLAQIWDTPDSFTYNSIPITRPSLTILAAMQTDVISTVFPEEIWNMGIMGRFLLVCGAEPITMKGEASEQQMDLTPLEPISGELPWGSSAQAAINSWRKHLMPMSFVLPPFRGYYSRRYIYGIKLAMISAISRGAKEVSRGDVDRALAWLLELEDGLSTLF